MTIINHSPVDQETYDMLYEIMAEEFDELLDCFRTDTTQAIGELQHHIKNEQSEEVGAICHKLKSSSLLIGALKLAELFQQLEEYADHHNSQLATGLLQAVKKENNAVLYWLDGQAIAA